LSAVSTVCPYPPGDTPGTHLCERLSRPHSAAGRIKSMKNINVSIGNQTRELPNCSAVPHPTAPPFATSSWIKSIHYEEQKLGNVSELRWKVNNVLRPFTTSGNFSPKASVSHPEDSDLQQHRSKNLRTPSLQQGMGSCCLHVLNVCKAAMYYLFPQAVVA
jgi:hypothetical protein